MIDTTNLFSFTKSLKSSIVRIYLECHLPSLSLTVSNMSSDVGDSVSPLLESHIDTPEEVSKRMSENKS